MGGEDGTMQGQANYSKGACKIDGTANVDDKALDFFVRGYEGVDSQYTGTVNDDMDAFVGTWVGIGYEGNPGWTGTFTWSVQFAEEVFPEMGDCEWMTFDEEC